MRQFNIVASQNVQANPAAYHVHIYFTPGTASESDTNALVKELEGRFPSAIKGVHSVGKIGPHTENNIDMTIPARDFGAVVPFLQMNSKGLSILIHPRTGDELADHGDAAMWLGKPVPFNQAFFSQFRPKPAANGNTPR